jgi:beta-glucosidase
MRTRIRIHVFLIHPDRFSPVINMWTDSRFGRLQEGYSENPTLTAAYAKAMVVGLQGVQPPGEWASFAADKVVALGKHYAAYGAAIGGLNGAPAELSERTLREWRVNPSSYVCCGA